MFNKPKNPSQVPFSTVEKKVSEKVVVQSVTKTPENNVFKLPEDNFFKAAMNVNIMTQKVEIFNNSAVQEKSTFVAPQTGPVTPQARAPVTPQSPQRSIEPPKKGNLFGLFARKSRDPRTRR